MHINKYLYGLDMIRDGIKQSMVFDFDKVLDGTYGFNISEASIVYDLIHIIEGIAVTGDSIVVTREENSLQKEFKFQFDSTIYSIYRLCGVEESIIIAKATSENSPFVEEFELLKHIEDKCRLSREMKGLQVEYINENTAG